MLDHIVALAFAIGFPAITGPAYLRRRAQMLAGNPSVRRSEYLETIAWLSAMGVAAVLAFVVGDRALSGLGLSFDFTFRHLSALLIAAIAGAFLFAQAIAVARDPGMQKAARESLESVREYLPRDAQDARLFRGVAISAGIGEELFYRGFLLWYLSQAVSLPVAVAISSVLFALAHWMHGYQAVIRAGLIGLLLAGLYLLGGALWAPMLLHTMADLSSGAMGQAAFANASDNRKRTAPIDQDRG